MKKPVYQKYLTTAIFSIMFSAIPGCLGVAAAEKQASLESRLQKLEDREEIRQLLKDYGRFLDQRDFASFSRLFAEKDGEWNGGMGKAKGSQAIRKLMEETIGQNGDKPAPPNYHLFMNEIINVNGHQADATTKWMFVVQGEKGGPQLVYLGHYEDTLVRENGRWKFFKRLVHSDIPSDKDLAKRGTPAAQ